MRREKIGKRVESKKGYTGGQEEEDKEAIKGEYGLTKRDRKGERRNKKRRKK